MAKPRGIRNHNPFNIRYNSAIDWVGQVGKDDAGFVIFKSADFGIRAAGRLMRTYKKKYKLNSIEGIVRRWAPESENDTQNYIRQVTRLTGLSSSKKLSERDYCKLANAMIQMENGQQPYSTKRINKALLSGLCGQKSDSSNKYQGVIARIVSLFTK